MHCLPNVAQIVARVKDVKRKVSGIRKIEEDEHTLDGTGLQNIDERAVGAIEWVV